MLFVAKNSVAVNSGVVADLSFAGAKCKQYT